MCRSALRWDLWWPPVWGGSYWTASLQYRALRGGARLGRALGRHNNVEEYDSRASMILDYLQVRNEYGAFVWLTPDLKLFQSFYRHSGTKRRDL